VGGRHDLRHDVAWVLVLGCCGGCVQTQGGGLGVWRTHDQRLSCRGVGHGVAYTSPRVGHPSFRPREPIHQRCVWQAMRGNEGKPSMGTVGDAYDNAMAESFFATLECELIDRRSWKTKAEARLAIFTWIESWYNPLRRHSVLGQRSPNAFDCDPFGRRLSPCRLIPYWSAPLTGTVHMQRQIAETCLWSAQGERRQSLQTSRWPILSDYSQRIED
jgi:hypothetical protein